MTNETIAALRSTYETKCADLAIDPSPAALKLFDNQSRDGEQTELILCGSCKELFNNRLDGMQICALAESLLDDTHIVHLDLSYNFMDDSGAQSIAHLLKINKTLKCINLAGNDITAVGAKTLSTILTVPAGYDGSNAVEMISLNGNPIGDDGAIAVAEMLKQNTNLKLVDLGNTGMAAKGIISICCALAENRSNVEVLSLERPLLKGPQDVVANHLANMLASNCKLKNLNLAQFGMVDAEFETIVATGLTKNSSICELDLHGNRLSGFSGPTLERMLKECQNIESLNLAANQLGSSGATALAECVPYSTLLRFLDVRNNRIGEPGLIALANALHVSANLSIFFVWGNSFGPISCETFMTLLERFQQDDRPLVIDIEPYEVDGEVKVALVDVE
ncbi:hypothetical protein BSKO_00822 [Bryopsis sp. KO-2023]|nr:hypothetical protein BSKO_00822 [Bryopsis sp. KO-2023]